jgi:glycosyltransferase involved in cell wall biosynthesis
MTKHRPLLVINALHPGGGAEIQLVHLARGLSALGHRVTLCCIDRSTVEPEALTEAGVRLVELGARTRHGRPAAIARLARLARQSDVVHCTMWDSSLWGRIAAIAARRPVIVADHATDRAVQVAASGVSRARWIALHNRVLDRFTFATVICATSQREVLTGEGVAPEKIVHIPNGIPVDEVVRLAAAGPARSELGLPEPAPLAMQVGVFRAEKNQLGALEAFRRVRERVAGAQLVFVGDGPMREAVERRAGEIGAGEWAHFLGHRSDVPALLEIADLMLQPSISDAMPMTVLESMALGVPVVATDVGDVRRVLGETGVCVAREDAESLAGECVRLFSDPALRARMGRAAAERARAYDSSRMVRRYEALFDAACDGRAPLGAIPDGD